MPGVPPVEPVVHWDLSSRPDGTSRLSFEGELDTESTPGAWRMLESELSALKPVSLEIDVQRLSCDSAGLALLYFLSSGGMTPGARVTLNGLNPELQHLLHSFSNADFQALQEHEPTCSSFIDDTGRAT